tara:strand:- start:4860 stop:5705 length:846 start_codon:yes stop_codon:yes gene_type:complete
MIIRALLPKLTPKTVKEKIIVILSSEFPLTIKELKQKIKHSFNQSVSYQSVHKELNQLMIDEIIISKDKKYLLNVEWIRQVGLFSDLIISNYTSERKHSINKLLELKNDGDSLSFEFETYAEVDRYFLELVAYFNEFFDSEYKILNHYPHSWWPILYPLQEKRAIEKLKSEFLCVCSSNSPIDKYCREYNNSIGLKAIYSTDKKLHWNVNIFGDLIITYYSDPGISQEVHNFFSKHKDFKTLDLKKLIELVDKKGRFRILIVKDSIFAKTVLASEIHLFNS